MLATNSTLKELNISNNARYISKGGPSFAKAFAVGLSTNGALENLHIGKNGIPVDKMNEIIALVEAKPAMKVFCAVPFRDKTITAKPAMKVLCAIPFRDKTITELDVSSQNLGIEGALVIRRYLENNGALTSLNISRNMLRSPGCAALAATLNSSSIAELNIADNQLSLHQDDTDYSKKDFTGLSQLADAIKNNGATRRLGRAEGSRIWIYNRIQAH